MFRQPSSNSRVDCWARELACRFRIKVIYRAGHANKCADALSRELPPAESDDSETSDEDNWFSTNAQSAIAFERSSKISSMLMQVKLLVPADSNVEIEAPENPLEFDKANWNRHFEEVPILSQVLLFLRKSNFSK